jgi:L-alanine-DL-glutamate epimerase-like enolase superfamily enzyme
MSAISGIEMALWDILGQALGAPIWQLLGGKFRDRIRLYNDCHAGQEETPEAYAAKAREVESRGFTALKFDIDPLPSRRDPYNHALSNEEIAHYLEIVTAIRRALQSNTDLADLYYINVAPHNIGSPIETVATCHVCAAVPNFLALEFHHLGNRLWDSLLLGDPLIAHGHIAVPDLPGLGVLLNEDAVRASARKNLGFL